MADGINGDSIGCRNNSPPFWASIQQAIQQWVQAPAIKCNPLKLTIKKATIAGRLFYFRACRSTCQNMSIVFFAYPTNYLFFYWLGDRENKPDQPNTLISLILR